MEKPPAREDIDIRKTNISLIKNPAVSHTDSSSVDYHEEYLSEQTNTKTFPWSNTKMGIRPFCSKRTDNHVKRVSCRDSSSLITSLGLCLSVIILTLAPAPCRAAAGDISCQGIRYTYFEKGLDTSDIPAAPQQGETNIILPTVIRVSHDLLLPALRQASVILSSSH